MARLRSGFFRMLFRIALSIVAVIAFLVWLAPPYADATARAKISDATNRASPARTAFSIACQERALSVGMVNRDLGLAEPEQYGVGGGIVQSIVVSVDLNAAKVTIELGEVRQDITRYWSRRAVEAGHTVELLGRCSEQGMTWRVGGTLPDKYLPSGYEREAWPETAQLLFGSETPAILPLRVGTDITQEELSEGQFKVKWTRPDDTTFRETVSATGSTRTRLREFGRVRTLMDQISPVKAGATAAMVKDSVKRAEGEEANDGNEAALTERARARHTSRYSVRVLGFEEVTTPAGTFETVVVMYDRVGVVSTAAGWERESRWRGDRRLFLWYSPYLRWPVLVRGGGVTTGQVRRLEITRAPLSGRSKTLPFPELSDVPDVSSSQSGNYLKLIELRTDGA